MPFKITAKEKQMILKRRKIAKGGTGTLRRRIIFLVKGLEKFQYQLDDLVADMENRDIPVNRQQYLAAAIASNAMGDVLKGLDLTVVPINKRDGAWLRDIAANYSITIPDYIE